MLDEYNFFGELALQTIILIFLNNVRGNLGIISVPWGLFVTVVYDDTQRNTQGTSILLNQLSVWKAFFFSHY